MDNTLRGTVVCEEGCGYTAVVTAVWDGQAFAVECPDCPAKANLA